MEKWYPLVANRTAKLSVNSMHFIWNERRLDFNKNVNQIHPKEVLGPERPGRKVAILCDTCNNEGVTDLCREVDCLVHEATLEDEQEKSCIEKGHSTPGSLISRVFRRRCVGIISVYISGCKPWCLQILLSRKRSRTHWQLCLHVHVAKYYLKDNLKNY